MNKKDELVARHHLSSLLRLIALMMEYPLLKYQMGFSVTTNTSNNNTNIPTSSQNVIQLFKILLS